MTRLRRVRSEGQLHQQQQRHNPQTVQGLVFVAAVTDSAHKSKKCPWTYLMQAGCRRRSGCCGVMGEEEGQSLGAQLENVNSSEVCIIRNLEPSPAEPSRTSLRVCTAVVNGLAWCSSRVTCSKASGWYYVMCKFRRSESPQSAIQVPSAGQTRRQS